MPNRWAGITIDCNDPVRLAAFWSALLGRAQVEQRGGSWSGARHDYDEGVVLVMGDPEQHEFCLVQYYR